MKNTQPAKSTGKTHVLVPAAGSGQRFGGPVPKQYIDLIGKPVIQHTLERLLEFSDRITVAISEDDNYWQSLEISKDSRIKAVLGGQSRAGSVKNALKSIAGTAKDDWVLIHDAVRPLVMLSDIEKLANYLVVGQNSDKLIDTSLAAPFKGGLLATPIYETVKRANDDAEVVKTEDRSGLWAAQTPQMFRYNCLIEVLEASASTERITDEASAMEAAGHRIKLVDGSRTNVKITRPEDFEFAELILGSQKSTVK